MRRQLVKQEAKNCLRGNWKNAIIILILLALIPQVVSTVSDFIITNMINSGLLVSADWTSIIESVAKDGYFMEGAIQGAIIGTAINAISWTVTIILYMFTLSKIGFFFKIVEGENPALKEFSKTGRYSESIRIELYVALRLFLWALIGIVPMVIGYFMTINGNISATILLSLGAIAMLVIFVIKMLSYYMAIYLKYKNPEKSCSECVRESVKIMNGYKGQLFVLFLSFIGWYLLVALGTSVLNAIIEYGGVPGYYIGNILSVIYSLIANAALGAYILSSTVIFYKEMTNPYLEQKYFYGTAPQMGATAMGAGNPFGSNTGSVSSDNGATENGEVATNLETVEKEETKKEETEEKITPTASINDSDDEKTE